MSKKNWNSKHCKLAMKNLENSVKEEYPELDLNYPYIDTLCHQTNSPRIMSLIRQAYYLGMARGIKMVDDGMTPITLDPLEMDFHNPTDPQM